MGDDFAKNTKPEKNKSQPLLLVAVISLSTRKIERGRGPSHLSAHMKFPIQQKDQEGDNSEGDLQATRSRPRTAPRLSQG